MEKDFTGGMQPELIPPPGAIERATYIGNPGTRTFAVAVDGDGKLSWDSNETGGDHIIELLTEQVSDAYLYYLQQKRYGVPQK